jgi:activator of HSP90 ATPase
MYRREYIMAKTIKQEKLFNAPPNKLYKYYMDEGIHSDITGEKAKIGEKAGENFSALKGIIKGKLLYLKKNKMVVQTWRNKEWDKTIMDSIVTLTFNGNEDGSTHMSLYQSNIPEDYLDDVKQRWNNYFWKPLKKYINNPSGNKSGQGKKSASGAKTKKTAKRGRRKPNMTIA